ncbi:thioredoxin-like protein [Lineolata rhizophorae]|uniref:Large ribosomal subunit protein mL43 n=1 Tax=Lineolata rhizophorae TaxID=578093 RepID=A0A6A6NPB4_9PEZI|nr:thioredoxin-like protein [Lineolata rhizophorae]
MPVSAIRTITKNQNGVGAFILQCKRIDFHYCDWEGSSKGMRSFLRSRLADFARANPAIEINVSPRPRKQPILRGVYVNGRDKQICVRNMEPTQIIKKCELLRDASGEPLRRDTKPVKSINESVRGVWSPYHGAQFKI